ncbi:Smg-4/UPF3 family-domain-containing protein [Dichotomopilus funicola]|uniref:Smg-4/UPF3 family-domain-containing protein n=1 Tax=Dichotomopilus funicola TaxID=1934379 RepID=A0AAN6UW65_9PEZI|nr:Smg-4/UPF3 family-domain-containing protein [Dichotomopilus funicola]
MAAPQLLSRRTNGEASGQPSHDTPKAARVKAPAQGEKAVVRRLPPAMTEDEFVAILGDEWRVGRGKVDWFSYWPGKVSQHPSKPSQPSRAYLHVTRRDELTNLLQTVQSATWEDAKESYNDPALVSSPTVEFAAYKKIPGEKKRVDGRQGTIDQDPEFMAFLEALANPEAHKEAAEGEQGLEDTGKGDKTTTTPLVEYLKEKKAARVKEAVAAKNAKHGRQDSQGTKGKNAVALPEEPKKRSRESRAEKEKASEKAPERPRESVKILTKKAAAAAEAAAEAAKATKAAAAQATPSASSTSPAENREPLPKSRRAGIAAAARILQRDLGLSPGNAHRKARQEAAKADLEAKAAAAPKEITNQQTPTASEPANVAEPIAENPPAKTQPATSSRSRNRKRGAGGDAGKAEAGPNGSAVEAPAQTPAKAPITVLKKDTQQKTPTDSPSTPSQVGASKTAASASAAAPPATKPASQKQVGCSKKAPAPASPSSGATRAFIKHANHSQGVTEPLLREALRTYGAVTNVEIDRKKGFAYVDFAEHAGLVQAMAASPIAVAQATVQVLERKDMGKKTSSATGAGPQQQQQQPQEKSKKASAVEAAPASASAAGSAPAKVQQAAEPLAEKAAAGGEPSKRSARRRGRGRGGGDKEGKDGKDGKEGKESAREGGGGKKGSEGGVTAAGTG